MSEYNKNYPQYKDNYPQYFGEDEPQPPEPVEDWVNIGSLPYEDVFPNNVWTSPQQDTKKCEGAYAYMMSIPSEVINNDFLNVKKFRVKDENKMCADNPLYWVYVTFNGEVKTGSGSEIEWLITISEEDIEQISQFVLYVNSNELFENITFEGVNWDE